jgi:hypothetical protein
MSARLTALIWLGSTPRTWSALKIACQVVKPHGVSAIDGTVPQELKRSIRADP